MYPDDSLTLHTDLYQINMMQVYFDQGIHNKKAVFEVYFRQQPFNNGYAVFAGLERIVKYLEDLRFSDSDIDYLESPYKTIPTLGKDIITKRICDLDFFTLKRS